ncbi:MAG: hypothetical protein ACFFCH_06745 [Promethearchaeota archaeon]
MLGWILLLIWANFKPLERRFVAILAIIVMIRLFLANVAELVFQILCWMNFVHTFMIQVFIITLFSIGWIATTNLIETD